MPQFTPSRTPYLVRHVESGNYYAQKKLGGMLRRATLKTDSEYVAKLRLPIKLAEMHKRFGQENTDESLATFGGCAVIYRGQVNANGKYKPLSRAYRLSTLAMLERTWPGYEALELRKLDLPAVKAWAEKAKAKYSAGRYNSLLDTVRAIFALATDAGIMRKNWALEIDKVEVVTKPVDLPSPKQFMAIFEKLENNPHTTESGKIARFLACTGLRIGHAGLLLVRYVDLENAQLTVPPFKHTKVWRTIPILPELKETIRDMIEGQKPDAPLLKFKSIRNALRTASLSCGVLLTHQRLRHYFTTRCLECGVDIPTVAKWRGDKDGGKMLLKTYAHLRDEHSKAMAAKVTMGLPASPVDS